MSFVQRELDRIQSALKSRRESYAELYAAQQALARAQEPEGFASLLRRITGIPGEKEDYRGEDRQQQS